MQKRYPIGAILITAAICMMCWGSIQAAAQQQLLDDIAYSKAQEVYYITGFPGMLVELYPQRDMQNEYHVYDRFIVGLNGHYHRTNWHWNASLYPDTTEYIDPPTIYYEDINQDGQKEIVFVFGDGINNGTGVCLSDSYVIGADGTEYTVENPLDYLRTNINNAISLPGTDIVIDIYTPQQQYQFRTPQALWGEPGNISLTDTGAQAGIPDWVVYRIEDGRLFAEVPFNIFASGTIGHFNLYYEEIDGAYRITSVTCAEY